MKISELEQQFAEANGMEGMFETPSNIMDEMGDMAAEIAVKQATYKDLETRLSALKTELDADKEQLAMKMFANNCANGHKFDNGILVKPKQATKIFKAGGVETGTMHQWLRDNNLGGIIIDYVHWQTMNATLKAEIEAGKELPTDIFNVTEAQTVSFAGNGHIKYLAQLKNQNN